MRSIVVALALVAGTAFVTPESTLTWLVSATPSVAGAAALDQQQPDLKIDVDVDRGGGAWYTSPVWLAIGGLAVLLILVLIVVAARGGGTTVIKE